MAATSIGFLDQFPTYEGAKPLEKGIYLNEEKQQIEDWTHRSLSAEEPSPLALPIAKLGSSPEVAFERWMRGLTSDQGGGTFK